MRRTLFANAVVLLLGAALLGAVTSTVSAAPAPESELRGKEAADRLPLPGQPGFSFGILGSMEIRTPVHHLQPQWSDLLARIEAEKPLYDVCASGADCPAGVKEWRAALTELKSLPRRDQMSRVNILVNRLVAYADDAKTFGKRDHWATPAEALLGRGDCEDYAVLKFQSLIELGFAPEQLRVTIVNNRQRALMHAVLAVRLDGKTYILDNLNDHAVEEQYLLKYAPLYSATLGAQWVHIVTNPIRARYVSHIMDRESEKALPTPAIAGTELPAPKVEKSVRLYGDYSHDWT